MHHYFILTCAWWFTLKGAINFFAFVHNPDRVHYPRIATATAAVVYALLAYWAWSL